MTFAVALRAALALGDIATKSTFILATAWVCVRLLKHRTAATRHMVWLTAFTMLLLIPMLSGVMPTTALSVVKDPSLKVNVSRANPPKPEQLDSNQKTLLAESVLKEPASPTSPFEQKAMKAPQQHGRVDWYTVSVVILVIWLVGALAAISHGMWGYRGLRRLYRHSLEAHVRLEGIDQLSRRIGLRRPWRLRVSGMKQPPAAMTWGFVRPIVLIPKDSDSWTQERLEAVLLHELAHVRRFDSMSQLIAFAASALYWFNPLVWLCARAMRAEAETAADDTVLRLGIKPSDYAQELLRIAAELGQRRQPLTNIGVPVMKQSKIESRVKAILDPSARRTRGVTLIEALSAVVVGALILIPLCSVRAAVLPDPPRVVPIQGSKLEDEARAQADFHAKIEAERLAAAKTTQEESIRKQIDEETQLLAERDRKAKGTAQDLESQKLRLELKQLMAEAAEMRAQLAHARADLKQARQELEAESMALRQLKEAKRKQTSGNKEQTKRDLMILESIKRREEAIFRQLQSENSKKDSAWKLTPSAAKDREIARMRELTDRYSAEKLRSDDRRLQQIDAAKQLDKARIQVDMARKQLERTKKQHAEGYAPAHEVETATANLKLAEVALAAAMATMEVAHKK